MSYTQMLLCKHEDTKLEELVLELEGGLKKNDLLESVAEETFNGTMPILSITNNIQFKKTIKLAISCRYAAPKSLVTIKDLLNGSNKCFKEKIQKNLIEAAENMGTHVPKVINACVQDGAICFDRPAALPSGVTSGTVDSGRWMTGSKNAARVVGFNFLAVTCCIDNGPVLSLFERIAIKDLAVIELLQELGGEKALIQALIDTAARHRVEKPPQKISQFHKQNFVNFAGKRITVTPLQSVNTAVALLQAIRAASSVNIKHYAAGGARFQNVSSLNKDMKGKLAHIKAWVPSRRRFSDVFYYLYHTRHLSLDYDQKILAATIANVIGRIESRGYSNQSDREALNTIFVRQATLWLTMLESFAFAFNQLDDDKARNKVREKINQQVKAYFSADTVQAKTQASEAMAMGLVALVASQLKRNKLNVHIEDEAVAVVTQVLQQGDVLCRLL